MEDYTSMQEPMEFQTFPAEGGVDLDAFERGEELDEMSSSPASPFGLSAASADDESDAASRMSYTDSSAGASSFEAACDQYFA